MYATKIKMCAINNIKLTQYGQEEIDVQLHFSWAQKVKPHNP